RAPRRQVAGSPVRLPDREAGDLAVRDVKRGHLGGVASGAAVVVELARPRRRFGPWVVRLLRLDGAAIQLGDEGVGVAQPHAAAGDERTGVVERPRIGAVWHAGREHALDAARGILLVHPEREAGAVAQAVAVPA